MPNPPQSPITDLPVDRGSTRAAPGLNRTLLAAQPDRVQIVREHARGPLAQLLGWIVLGVQIATGEGVELAARKRDDETRRALRRRPRRIVGEAPRHLRLHEPWADREDEDVLRRE